MRPWLQDPDGDGTYTWSTDQIPAGVYEFKVAHGLSWDENYGAGGAPGRRQHRLHRAVRRHASSTFSLRPRDARAHRRRRRPAGAAPDLTKQRAVLGERGPARVAGRHGPGRATPALLKLAAALVAGRRAGRRRRGDHRRHVGAAALRPRRAVRRRSWPRTPSSQGYLALRLDGKTRRAGAGDPQGSGRGRQYDDARPAARRHRRADRLRPRRPVCRGRGQRVPTASPSAGGHRPSGVWAPTAQKVDLLTWAAGRGGRCAGQRRDAHAPDAGVGRLVVRLGRRAERRATSTRSTVYVPDHGRRSRQPGDRPVLGRADAGLDPVGGRGPRRHGIPAVGCGGPRSAGARAGRRLDDLRAPRARLLDQRRDRAAPRTAAPTSRSRTNGDGTQAPARRSPTAGLNTVHLLPTFDIASIPEDPAKQADAGVRPRVVRPGQRRSSRPASTAVPGQGRLQLGLRPVALDGAGGLVRLDGRQGRRRSAGRRVPHHGRRAAPATACGSCSTRSSTTRRRPARRRRACSTRSCPATTSG